MLTNTAIGVGQLATCPSGSIRCRRSHRRELAAAQFCRPVAGSCDHRSLRTRCTSAMRTRWRPYRALGRLLARGRTEELRQLNLSPIINGVRKLAPDFVRAGLPPTPEHRQRPVGHPQVQMQALTFLFQRRYPRATLQAHYTLAGAYSYGGSTGNRSGAGLAQDQSDIFNRVNGDRMGPTSVTGWWPRACQAAVRIQLSPVLQLASARPQPDGQSRSGADRTNNDRWVDPATGKQIRSIGPRGQDNGRGPALEQFAPPGATRNSGSCRAVQRLQHGQLRCELFGQRE